MNYKISHPTKIVNCDIELPASKSLSNRLLIIQALCNTDFKIDNLSDSYDTKYLQRALISDKNTIDVGHAGTTFRFLTSYLSSQNNTELVLTGSDRMKERPIKGLVNALRGMGSKIDYLEKEGFPPLKITGGKLEGGKIEIDGEISSQFITSILLIAPILKKGIELHINKEIVSRTYIEMTLALMKEFGIDSHWKDNIISIEPQSYTAKRYKLESDWSSASFWFEIAALSNSCEIKLNGLKEDSIQGDKKNIAIFNKLGVDSSFEEGVLILKKNQNIHANKSYDLLNTPDIYQSLRCTLFGLNIKSKFLGLSTLKDKETNRIIAVDNELEKLTSSKIIDTYKDHRMAMSFAPCCLRFGELQINDVEVVNKSYPKFWKDLKKAGFIISVLSH
ncbi:MAG: 3-phosphoshikimate 1-carboxyvinyltransferase [Flavobacteriales bacterium]|nr:3-phosphoshikimate 1-carboxyvinyltransferase [Flavobacteriales bacterium]